MSERVDDIERRISNERRHIDQTLEELEHRLSTRRLMDQGWSYLRSKGLSFFGGWGRAMKRNPFPLALTAAGLTLVPSLRRHSVPLALTTAGLTLMAKSAMAERAPEVRSAGRWDEWQGTAYDTQERRHRAGLLERAHDVAHELKQQIDETADAFAERVAHAQAEVLGVARRGGESASDFAARVRRTLNDGLESVREGVRQGGEAVTDFAGRMSSAAMHGVQSVRDGVRDGVNQGAEMASNAADYVSTAVSHGAQNVKETVMHGAEQARDLANRGREQAGVFLREQPLLAIAIGVGFGALLGALIPSSPMERRNLGPLADRARDDLKQKAQVLEETAERVASGAVEAATSGAERAVRKWDDNPQSRH